MIAPDNKASFLLRNRSALFRNISKAHHTSPHKSVPLRELWFLSIITYSYMSFPCIVAFPSPCGDYGSYLWSYLYRTIRRPHEESVPLRGLWFLSKYMTINWPQSRRRIRPLAGIMVLIGIVLLAFSKSKLGTNPSPCGDYGSYLVVDDTKGLITSSESVPLRGLWFLSADQQARFAFDQDGIRPLAGIMVLIRTLYRWLYEAVEMAFCGADHIFSSFFVFCKKMIFKKSFRLEF